MIKTNIVDEDTLDILEACNIEKLCNKLQDKTILITGASGMIGSYFIYTIMKLNEIKNTNTKVIAIVRNIDKLDVSIRENENVKVIVHDVTEPLFVEGNVDYIVHAASPASPKIMKEHPVETNFANTLGTAYTLKLALEKKALGYLFLSSREIYGEPKKDQEFFYEDGELGTLDHLIPRNGYAEGKKAAENMCVSFKDEYGLNVKVMRLAHTYGPGMSIYDGRVQADFLNNVIHNQNIVMKSKGESVRSYTYIADAIKAAFLILFESKDIVYNVGNENAKTSIRELAEILTSIEPEKKLKVEFDIAEDNKGCSSFTGGILSSNKIKSELGWDPKYNIKEGFARTIAHLEQEISIEETQKLKLRKI